MSLCKDGDWEEGGCFHPFISSTSCSTPECSLQKLSLLLIPTLSCSGAGGSLLSSFRCSGPNYYLYCTKGNLLGDSWACCQALGPTVFSASPKCRSGVWPWCNGKWQSAFGNLQLLKPFFPLCPEKAAPPRICLFTGPFPLQI